MRDSDRGRDTDRDRGTDRDRDRDIRVGTQRVVTAPRSSHYALAGEQEQDRWGASASADGPADARADAVMAACKLHATLEAIAGGDAGPI